MSWTNMKCPECGKERTMLPEWKACGYCKNEGEELPKMWHAWRNNVCRRLTAEQVRIIRASGASDSMLATRFGVSTTSIWMARNGRTYRWVA